MKDQLLNWGFLQKLSDVFVIESENISIEVNLNDDETLSDVLVYIKGQTAPVPNCTNKIALFTFLYNLGLIEI